MPRLPPSLFASARRVSPAAAVLLPACRHLPSSLRELRWIRELVDATETTTTAATATRRVWELCRRRGKGVPLQYVLGSQPFGHLEMLCRPGVLIPQ